MSSGRTALTRANLSPGAFGRHLIGGDPSAPVVVLAAFVTMGVITALDLTDGHLGFAFSLGFVLVVMTAPLAIRLRSIVVTGVLPPPLLIVTLVAVVLIDPAAVAVQGVTAEHGTAARAVAATLDHGLTLIVGHGLALAMIVVRNAWASRARALVVQPA